MNQVKLQKKTLLVTNPTITLFFFAYFTATLMETIFLLKKGETIMMKDYYVVTELVSEQERFNEPYKIDLTDEEFNIFEEFAYLNDPGFVGIREATFNEMDKADINMFGNLIDRTTLQVHISERIRNLNEEIKRLEEMMEKLNK